LFFDYLPPLYRDLAMMQFYCAGRIGEICGIQWSNIDMKNCTVQINYRDAQRKSGVPYSGTHILRHGMAKLARQVGGGLDAVLAMTGHKDLKLANHYSKCTEDDQKKFSEKIMEHIRTVLRENNENHATFSNVVSLKKFQKAVNN